MLKPRTALKALNQEMVAAMLLLVMKGQEAIGHQTRGLPYCPMGQQQRLPMGLTAALSLPRKKLLQPAAKRLLVLVLKMLARAVLEEARCKEEAASCCS